ncbi:MAG TPA: hypothetical protein VHR66_25955 [Gemmataceae bacterium]|jgi:hypothetical protein|nr:hypothetical protein [Gemmataceae bacterium]
MTKRLIASSLTLLALTIGVRAGDPPTKATPANAGFEKLKALAGTWVEADKDGKPTDKIVSVIKVTAAGSAVHETTFPGEPMEMVSVYHLDGPDLIMTHYCALGNQPRMKADPKSSPNTIHWAFAGGTNLDVSKDMHMHEATLKFIDADHIQLDGVAWVGGKPAEDHCGTMKLVRKK